MYYLVVQPSLSSKPHVIVGMFCKEETAFLYGVDHLERIDGGLVFGRLLQRMKELEQVAKARYRDVKVLIDMQEATREIWSAFRNGGVVATPIFVDKGIEGFGTKTTREELLSVVYLSYGSGRLRWSKALELSAEFREQIRNFRSRPEREYIDGRVITGDAGSEDLVRCVALGVWYAERKKIDSSNRKAKEKEYDPLRA